MATFKFLLFSSLSLGGLGLVFGLLLGYASKKFAVYMDPRVKEVRDSLPGANCGGCGYAGCDAYASAVVSGEAPPSLCSVGGVAVAQRISQILGVEVHMEERKVAFVKCGGTPDKASWKYDYFGSHDCRKAVITPGGGPKACEHGCMGFGTCVKVCQFDGIHIVDGIAKVDYDNCVGCGACVEMCPKGVIELRPISRRIAVVCNSNEKGREVKGICSVGCIGCGICARVCPSGAIEMVDNLPIINYEKCISCGLCVEKCPTGTVAFLAKEFESKSQKEA